MSAATEQVVTDLGTYAIDAIHILQRRIRDLEAELEAKNRELEELRS